MKKKPLNDADNYFVRIEAPMLQTYFRLLRYLKPLLPAFILSIIGFAVFAASAPMLAKLMEAVIHAIEHKDSASRWILPLLAIGIFVVRGTGAFVGTYFNSYVANRLITHIRIEIFNHMTTLPAEYFNKTSDGQILQRLVGSVGLLSKAITDAIKVLIREGLTVVFLLGYAFYLNWQLSLTFLAVAPLTLLVAVYTTKRFRKITKKDEGVMAGLMQVAQEMISGHEVMRVFDGQEYEKVRYQSAAENSYKRKMQLVKIQAIATPFTQLIVATALAIIIFLLLQPTTLAHHATGELVGYLTAVALIPKSMKQLSGLNLDIQKGIAGAQIIFDLLDTASEIDTGTFESERVRGNVSAKHVSFRYNPSQAPVLEDISFDIHPGEMVALVGKSGSGKSTLASLLQRFYDVETGSLTIDGIDIREYKLANLRKHISFVSQNLILFDDSIRNNIAYGSLNDCSDEQILDAAKKAHAFEFIQQLPDGLETQIGGNGLQLSGGQRQRIAIARAFLKDAPILILDEATSALDNESEKMIQLALDDVMAGKTTIVIAHRLSTIERANKIMVMSNGVIVEEGSHHDLLAKEDGVYRKLYLSSVDNVIGA